MAVRRTADRVDAEISKAVEAGKKAYGGFELPGRTLGVVGLGAIGRLVANAGVALGMNVVGFDPGLTVEGAWQLSASVRKAESLDDLLRAADFVTIHVPLIDATKNLINAERLSIMKKGVVLINFAREGIVDAAAVSAGIRSGKCMGTSATSRRTASAPRTRHRAAAPGRVDSRGRGQLRRDGRR